MLNKAGKAAEKVVTAGLIGAGKAIQVGLKAAGVTTGAAAVVVLQVIGAALAGWMAGKWLNKALSGEEAEVAKAQASVDAIQARRALAAQLGVPVTSLTKEQNAPIMAAFKRAIDMIDHPEKYAGGEPYSQGGAEFYTRPSK